MITGSGNTVYLAITPARARSGRPLRAWQAANNAEALPDSKKLVPTKRPPMRAALAESALSWRSRTT